MALVNFTLQGKGGVGKSFVAALLAQYYQPRDGELICFDTDPVNRSFGGYKAFGVENVTLGERVDEINTRYFDDLLERILAAPENATIVIDNGASTFLPLLGYMVETQALTMIQEAGHEIRIHSIVTGGQGLTDTMEGLSQVLKYFNTIPIVVWLNEYFGRVERQVGKQVQTFEDSAIYRKNMDQITALVRLPELRKETFGLDIATMLKAHLTFAEAVESEEFGLMARQRLKMTWATMNAAMTEAGL
ncbi:MAG: conjugal transfer protein TraL [Rhodospirillum sp.]|nr:conjugal transfer protein TraL [Rhodospirillum sp.]MCF8501777.1 conjugal transfer protein TraL [Rhodospirillum sp.]